MSITVTDMNGHFKLSFVAMASDCNILVKASRKRAVELTRLLFQEVNRIEQKFSRYDPTSVVGTINSSNGCPIPIDKETKRLLDYANQCYQLSDGLFDITTGAFRKIWHFKNTQALPLQQEISECLINTGWTRVKYSADEIVLPVGMALDFGGFGKEYAVDCLATIVRNHADIDVLVDLGGDMVAVGSHEWQVGIEHPEHIEQAVAKIPLCNSALATSGDGYRSTALNGKLYSHVIHPKTGWPVESPPSSVTVQSENCTTAGLLTTLAMLHGMEAESFLNAQAVPHWIYRVENRK